MNNNIFKYTNLIIDNIELLKLQPISIIANIDIDNKYTYTRTIVQNFPKKISYLNTKYNKNLISNNIYHIDNIVGNPAKLKYNDFFYNSKYPLYTSVYMPVVKHC